MSNFLKIFMLTVMLAILGCSVDINPGSFAVSVSPDSHDFGSVSIGEPVTVTFTVKNKSTNSVFISELRIEGTNANDFTITEGDMVPAEIIVDGEYNITVQLSPTAEGFLEASLFITHDGEGSPIEVKMTGIGVFGEGIVLVPGTLDFGDILVGESISANLTISNGTEDFLNVTDIILEGAYVGDFTILSGGSTPTDIPPKSLHIITVEFAPSDIGSRDGLITVSYDGMIDPLQAVLFGSGILSSSFEVNPSTYDFGYVGINAPVNADFIISNTGNSDLIISSIDIIEDIDGEFVITDGMVFSDIIVPIGGTHEFTITFTPISVGLKTAKFSITHSADSMPYIGEISGSGSDTPTISPDAHDFGILNVGNTSAPFTFTVTNPTSSDIIITNISITGADASAYAVDPPISTPILLLAGGGTQEINITFTPTKTDIHMATLSVIIDASPEPLEAQLMGSGSSNPEFSINPPCGSPYDFGSIPFNSSKTAEFTVTNSGSGTLSLLSISIENDTEGNFSIISGGAPADITIGSHIIEVKFSPISIGSKSATLRIEHNATGSPCLITLTGEAATVNLTPTSHNFGNVPIGDTPPTKTFTITNNTGNAITVTLVEITGTDATQFKANPSGVMNQNVPPGGGTLNIVVSCIPTKTGALSATLKITHTLGSLSATLSATGTGSPELLVTPSSYDFGTLTLATPSQSKSQTFIVSNPGTGTLTISAIAITGIDAVNFTITSGGSPVNLDHGDTHQVVVKFEPIHFGAKQAAIQFTHDGVSPASPHNVALYGNAIGPDFVLIPEVTAYSMGDGLVKKNKRKGFYIKNGGNLTLRVTSITISNTTDYSLVNAGAKNLTANDITYFYLDFSPQSIGNKGCTLTINHNSTGSPHTVTVSGNGIASADEIFENFDGSSAPSGWGYTGIWQWGVPRNVGPSSAQSGTKCFGTNISANYSRNQFCYLVTPNMNMTAALAPKMTFYMWMDTYHWASYAQYQACGWLEISTDGGTTWSRTVTPDPAYNSTATVNGNNINVWGGYYGTLFRNWQRVDVNLSSFVGKSDVMVAWYFYSANYNYTRSGWYIDSVSIFDSEKPMPNNPGPQDNDITTKTSGGSYTLKWDCSGATTYDVFFGEVNPPVSRVANDISSKQHIVTVTTGKKYFWRVEAASGGTIIKSKVFYFETVAAHPTVLINEIETGTVDWIEFYNPGSSVVYIGGYQCTIYSKSKSSPDGTFTFDTYLLLKPGETIVFHDTTASSTYSNRVDFDFDWDNAAQAIEVILKKHSFYPTNGVDYMKVNTLDSHKPSDLNWSGSATSNLTNYYNWYRNSSTDTDSATNWTVRRNTADKDAKNPGQ